MQSKSALMVTTCLAISVVFTATMHIPARATDWNFQEIVVDDKPPQPARITDCTIVDINADGKPDLWYSARKGKRSHNDHFMPWYENTGDVRNWRRHLPFAGPACYGTWGDVDCDGDMDLIASKDRKQSLVWMQNPLEEGADPRKGPWNIYQIYPGALMDPDEVHASYVGSDNRIHHNLDMNGDGRLDFVVAKYDGLVYYVPILSNPKTRSGSWAFYEIGESGGTARLADLDSDGDVEIPRSRGRHLRMENSRVLQKWPLAILMVTVALTSFSAVKSPNREWHGFAIVAATPQKNGINTL
jgi:hypothetical protein